MGLSMRMYWLSVYIWDIIVYVTLFLSETPLHLNSTSLTSVGQPISQMIVMVILFAISVAFGLRFFTQTNWIILLVLFLCWGHAQFSLAVLLSTLFDRTRPATGMIQEFEYADSLIAAASHWISVSFHWNDSWIRYQLSRYVLLRSTPHVVIVERTEAVHFFFFSLEAVLDADKLPVLFCLWPPWAFLRGIFEIAQYCGAWNCLHLSQFWSSQVRTCISIFLPLS